MVATKPDKSKPPVFHQIELARGWRILREHVKIQVDLDARAISGSASFDFCALNHQFVNVALNLRRCRVNACRINGQPAPFRVVSPLDDDELLQAVSSDTSRHRIGNVEHSMRVRDEAAFAQGELVIDLPASISADVIDELNEAIKKVAKPAGPLEQEFDPNAAPPVPLDQLPTLNVYVEYQVLDPTAGAVHYGNKAAPNPVLDPVYMLTDSRYGMPRFWVPCIDSMHWCDRYLFDFDIAVKSHLMVVASGELIETRLYPGDEMLDAESLEPVKVFKYRLHAPSHASEIVLAVGPFIPLPDPVLSNTVTHFCLPGLAHELVHTCPPLFAKALAFCRDYFGSDPPTSSFKHLFVGSLGLRADATIAGAGGIVVYSGDLLHTPRNIDEGLVAREAVMSGLVMSYFGRFLRPRSAEDDWLICGLAAHVTALGLQAILGHNWYRFRILDLMDELRKEASCDLSDIKINEVTDATLESVKRRSHVIVYMVEKRIGSDVLKRALRDIVAEGRSITVATLKLFDVALAKPVVAAENDVLNGSIPRYSEGPRILTDLNGNDPEHSGSSGVVSSGFDEAVQGVSVGPFLKRLRAICGTDVRSMVRLWAATPGIPRMQAAYQYNPRKHTIDLALRQQGVLKGYNYNGRKALLFTGSLHVRVMEIEGASDHTVEVRDAYCVPELPCHSRRAKHKSAAQAEKEFNENPARASPVLWVRIDPDTEWCKDLNFRQSEDSWTALLKGERDAVAQFEACRGLSSFGSEMSAKALLMLLEDEQLYWRVRAEAASVLATCEGGLNMLLTYFRSCYADNTGSNLGLVRPNNFSNLANYFVKRAMIKAITEARISGSRSERAPKCSVPVEAAEFLSQMLSSNDNAGNEFSDDHYVVDLLNACGKVGVLCLGDERHAKAGEDGSSTTDCITRQLVRYRSIEQLIPTRSGLVAAAITKALCDIEVGKMVLENNSEHGGLSRSILKGRFSANAVLLRSIHELSNRECMHDTRVTAITCLARAYGGDLEVALWLLARCDRNSSDEDILDIQWGARDHKQSSDWGFIEAPVLRYKVLDALTHAASSEVWGTSSAPLLLALRRHTKRAMQLCVRILRLSVGDSDPRVRSSALRFAKTVWGEGVPVCLLARTEYTEAKRQARQGSKVQIAEIVPLKTNAGSSQPQITQPLKAVKLSKPSKTTKSGKGSKSSKRKFSIPKSAIQATPLSDGKSGEVAPVDVDAMDIEEVQDDDYLEVKRDNPQGQAVIELDPKPLVPTRRTPSHVPLAVPKSVPASRVPKAVTTGTPKDLRNTVHIPKSSPPAIPKSIPTSVPKSTPKSIPKTIPRSIPKSAPKSMPRSIPKSIPRSIPRSIPKSIPKVPPSIPKSVPVAQSASVVPFPWHPLDAEDLQYVRQAWKETNAAEAIRRDRSTDDTVQSESVHTAAEASNGGPVQLANGTDSERKKKKKKKKRRHLEGDDGHRKKKKRKKQRDETGKYTDREPNFADEFLDHNGAPANGEGGPASGQRKIGKFKIKLSSVAPAEKSS